MPSDVCNDTIWNSNLTSNKTEEEVLREGLETILYNVLTPLVLAFGIAGNIFNLITLRSVTLQSVPFMYIRAIALFDLIGLICVSTFTTRFYYDPGTFAVAFYRAHIELTLLNACFAASLYTAVVLTLERYTMVSRPTRRANSTNPRFLAFINIAGAFMLGFLIHLPMSIQWTTRRAADGGWRNPNHKLTHCSSLYHPIPTIFAYYKIARESIRFSGVMLMSVLNVVITKKLQDAKKKRRRMTLKTTNKKKTSTVLNSFTEKRLTGMMIGITILYFLGNVPQAGVMILNQDKYKPLYWFQIYRGLANFMEVLNHCLNFYVFCITSKDYSATFLQHCLCVKGLLERLLCHPIDIRRKNSRQLETDTTSVMGGVEVEVEGGSGIVVDQLPREQSFLLTAQLHPDSDLVYL